MKSERRATLASSCQHPFGYGIELVFDLRAPVVTFRGFMGLPIWDGIERSDQIGLFGQIELRFPHIDRLPDPRSGEVDGMSRDNEVGIDDPSRSLGNPAGG